jgi:hypothetical protein
MDSKDVKDKKPGKEPKPCKPLKEPPVIKSGEIIVQPFEGDLMPSG